MDVYRTATSRCCPLRPRRSVRGGTMGFRDDLATSSRDPEIRRLATGVRVVASSPRTRSTRRLALSERGRASTRSRICAGSSM